VSCGVCWQGRRLLRQWFLRPVVQLDVIADRHNTLELLVAAPTTNDALRAAMKKVGARGAARKCRMPSRLSVWCCVYMNSTS
jgi:DNA mismatch repair ATPase MutS